MKKYLDLIINTSFLVILSICFNLIVFKSTSFLTIIYILITSIFLSCLIKLISDIFKNERVRKIINIIFLSIITFIFITQLIHFYFYDCFYSFYSLTKSGQIFEFIDFIFKIIKLHIIPILIILLLVILLIIFIIKTKNIRNKSKVLLEVILIVITPFIFIVISNFDKNSNSLLNDINSNSLNTNRFGLMPSMVIDIYRYNNPVVTKLDISKNNNTYNKENFNILDLEFRNTNDKSIKDLNNYIKNKTPTNKNEYTGIFKGKNLIFITGESFDFNIIDEDITPTLYKMKEEGIYFTNHYTPIYYASTSDGEYTNLSGNLPREGIWSYIESKDKYIPYSYGNLFKSMNYNTYSYHNGKYDFYDRYKVMPKFGFDTFKACGMNLNINCNLWPQSDEEMITESLNDYINDDHFVTYYMSISGHLSHSFKTNDMAKKHKNEVNSLNYSDTVKAYISGNIDLDKGLEKLLNMLEEKNKLDDTVIVLVPDHYPYGLIKNELNQIQIINNFYDKHKTGLLIYNKGVSKKIDKLSSNIDILPTLLNMYGIDYDSRIITGKDIMANHDRMVIFNDHSFLTNEGFYNSITEKFSTSIDNERLKELKKEVNNMYSMSNLIIDKDYYRYLLLKD